MTVLHPLPAEDPGEPALQPVHRTSAATAAPSRWAAAEKADESISSYRQNRFLDFLVIAVITLAGDLPLITTTFNRVVRDNPAISWGLGIALTLASVMLALTAGVYARKSSSARANAAVTSLLTLGWLLLGIGLFTLRWNAAQFAPAVVAYEGAADTAVAEAAKEQLLAVVLATVYVATGILAAIDGYKNTNPAAAAMRAARAKRDKILPHLQSQEARVARLSENLAVATREYTKLPDERTIALKAREALAAELKAYARVLMAIHLGDPSATGLVRPPDEAPEQPTDPQEGPPRAEDVE